MRDSGTKKNKLKSELYFLSEQQQTFAASQVELLEAIEQSGSISSAAKHLGISYKTAWDRIDAMNNMSPQSLVSRSAGGARGGGTALTDYGRRIVAGFRALQDEHDEYLRRLGSKFQSLNDVANFMKTGSVRTSARNQFQGSVKKIISGAVNSEVIVDISSSQIVVAIITNDSVDKLKLKKGSNVVALVKASWVLLAGDTSIATSARNKLVGVVSRIEEGAVNCDVTVDLGEGKSISAVITRESLQSLGLKEGEASCAFFKASSVILMA